MIRILIFLAVIAALAFGVGWLVDRPGQVSLVWQGWQVETTVPVLILAVCVITAAVMVVVALLRALIDIPDAVTHFFHGRRRRKGMNAIASGLVAVGVGDARAARRAANDARRFVGDEPLTLLLRAQAAQLSGDRAAAEEAFRAMLEAPETRPLGYRGLFVEARRRGDREEARRIADQSLTATPDVPWAGPALLELQADEGDWDSALATVERNRTGKIVAKDVAHRQRAVLLTAKAEKLAAHDRDEARRLAREAVKLAPDLVPAAALAGRLMAEAGEYRKASRILEAAWRANPHPDLAEAYVNVRPGDAAFDRLKRARRLADQRPGHEEGAIALAHAAIDARDFDAARSALEPLVAANPSRRACLLMAELEDADSGDRGRARAWLARAVAARHDPAWVADGVALDHWAPVSPVTGALAAFEWRVPQESLSAPGNRVLEAEMEAGAPSGAPLPLPEFTPGEEVEGDAPDEDAPPLMTPEEGEAQADLQRKDARIEVEPVPESAAPPSAAKSPDEPAPAPEPVAIVETPSDSARDQPVPATSEERKPEGKKPASVVSASGPSTEAAVLPLPRAPDDPGPDIRDDEDPDAPRLRQTIPGGP